MGGGKLLREHMNTITKATGTFQEPSPSRATRHIPLRSKASLRGTLIAQLPSEKHPRKIAFESRLERDFLLLSLARNDINSIWDQPPAIKYQNADGKRQSHTFDYLVSFTNGKKSAVAIKPSARVAKKDFISELRLIAASTPNAFADRVLLITERNLDRTEVQNAAMFHEFHRDADVAADANISELIKAISEPTTIGGLVRQSGLGARAFRAIVRAIYADDLSASRINPIDYSTPINAEAIQWPFA